MLLLFWKEKKREKKGGVSFFFTFFPGEFLNNVFKKRGKGEKRKTLLPRSPISAASPPGSSARSGRRAQASRQLSYHFFRKRRAEEEGEGLL